MTRVWSAFAGIAGTRAGLRAVERSKCEEAVPRFCERVRILLFEVVMGNVWTAVRAGFGMMKFL
jgi:hypothetical protein